MPGSIHIPSSIEFSFQKDSFIVHIWISILRFIVCSLFCSERILVGEVGKSCAQLRAHSCSFRVSLAKLQYLRSQFSQRMEGSSSLHSRWISSVSHTSTSDDMLVPPAWGETEGAESSSVFSLLNGQCITDIIPLSIPSVHFCNGVLQLHITDYGSSPLCTLSLQLLMSERWKVLMHLPSSSPQYIVS